ncbi:MAG TPA: DUF547 domain-containing protein [Alphaproteobacteria bacterium]|nr:DUF547 domain-containing protein [Alphaproteobacteria bacterium]
MTSRVAFSAVAFVLACLGWPHLSVAAPEAVPWAKWEAHNDASTAIIDHEVWDRFLNTYAHLGKDGIVRVAYGRVSAADHQALGADLARLAAITIRNYRRQEQLAFWIDLYNELTVNFVLDHYPVSGIKATSFLPGLFSETPWSRKLITIEGERLSLDDIEHRILRPGWHNPLVHYALNCASLGCPNLQPLAYTAANVDELLDRGAHEYVNHPRGVRIDDRKLVVSSIYVWYKADFGGNDEAVIAHLRRYAGPGLAQALSKIQRISSDHYDWSLNDDLLPKSSS